MPMGTMFGRGREGLGLGLGLGVVGGVLIGTEFLCSYKSAILSKRMSKKIPTGNCSG